MWKSLFDMLRQALTLTETSQRNQALLKELQKELRDFGQAMEERQRRCETAVKRLAYEVQRLRDELHHALRHEADEREKFQLQIENQLLKSQQRLPPAVDVKNDDEEKKS